MMGKFTTELIFTLTSNPKFQEVAELVYWNKDDIINCPENNEFVYAIDEGSVTQYAEKNSSWGKETFLVLFEKRQKSTPYVRPLLGKFL